MRGHWFQGKFRNSKTACLYSRVVQPGDMRMLCIKRQNNLITNQGFCISVLPTITLTVCPFWSKSVCLKGIFMAHNSVKRKQINGSITIYLYQ